ncbi:MAG: EcsC family protein [Rhizobacter sp.]|nr:EcsC family protein [Rhizobacter sp.]
MADALPLPEGETPQGGLATRLADAILSVVAVVPDSLEATQASPDARADQLTQHAARKAAGISAGAALVPGPLGVLSLLPDMYGVWKVQAQLVSDIAALYGQRGSLTREQMLYCLFKHTASQLLRDVVVRSGERYLVRRLSSQVLERLAARIGLRIGQRAVGKMAARFVPLLGAGVVGGYAYYDTRQVAATAMRLFSQVDTP